MNHHKNDPKGELRAQFPNDERGQKAYDALMEGTPIAAPSRDRITLSLLLRGLASEDAETRRTALGLVSSPELALRTAEGLMHYDTEAQAQFDDARQLSGFLRGRAGLITPAASQEGGVP